MSDAGLGKKIEKTFDEPESRPQDGDDHDVVRQNVPARSLERCPDRTCLQLQVIRHLEGHDGGDPSERRTEKVVVRAAVAQDRQVTLDERMVDDGQVLHGVRSFLCIAFAATSNGSQRGVKGGL